MSREQKTKRAKAFSDFSPQIPWTITMISKSYIITSARLPDESGGRGAAEDTVSSNAVENGDENRNYTFRTLRQQLQRREGVPDYALADFIAPKETGKQDYIGCFCVTTGFGTDELSEKYRKNLDDYNSIMIKALSDRLAEAFAEYLH